MKKIFVLLSAAVLLSIISCKTTESQEAAPVQEKPSIEIKEPESVYEIGASETKIFIKTDIPGANVYLNKIYQGKTPLEIEGLIPGYYLLKVERLSFLAARIDGIQEELCLIEVEKGQAQNYWFGDSSIPGKDIEP